MLVLFHDFDGDFSPGTVWHGMTMPKWVNGRVDVIGGFFAYFSGDSLLNYVGLHGNPKPETIPAEIIRMGS